MSDIDLADVLDVPAKRRDLLDVADVIISAIHGVGSEGDIEGTHRWRLLAGYA